MSRLRTPRWMTRKKRTPNLWLRIVACRACLAVLTVLVTELFVADHIENAPSLSDGKLRAARVVRADNGMHKLTVTLDGEKQKLMEVVPDATVLLNGSPAGLENILPGDLVSVETDDNGRAMRVEATRLFIGIVFSTEGEKKLVATTDFTDKAALPLT